MEIKNNNNIPVQVRVPFRLCSETVISTKKEEEIFNLLFCAFFLPLQPVLYGISAE